MGLLSYAMDRIFGRTTLMLYVGKRPAVEIMIEGKTITAAIKNPILAAELGFSEFMRSLESRSTDPISFLLDRLKSLDYTIKIKWGRLEIKI
ncbi:MAG TPA: hypothetical protein VJ485_02775 [archaeon]|nr:hypothetical protein [archaeon]